MKSLDEIKADNCAIAKRIVDDRVASLRRLKDRVRNAIPWEQQRTRSLVAAAIDAWDKAERKRGSR